MQVPTVRTSTFGKSSFRYAAPVLWNSLPDDFRKCSNFNQFKSLILSWNGKNCNCVAYNMGWESIAQVHSAFYVFLFAFFAFSLLYLCFVLSYLISVYFLVFHISLMCSVLSGMQCSCCIFIFINFNCLCSMFNYSIFFSVLCFPCFF